MSGDWSLETEAENKVIVKGDGKLTPDGLAAALNELSVRDVPHDAGLEVHASMSGQRWTIVAKWAPVISPPKAPIPVPVNPPLAPHHFDFNPALKLETDPEAIAARIQRDSRGLRKLKDNPQG